MISTVGKSIYRKWNTGKLWEKKRVTGLYLSLCRIQTERK